MQYSTSVLITALAVTNVVSHGVITEIKGANGVTMPGLTVVDGTPRDCPSSGCGAQADTAVIRENEFGTSEASALGRTKADGPVTAEKMMAVFMGTDGVNNTARDIHARATLYRRQLFGGGLGGLAGALGGAGGGAGGGAAGLAGGLAGALGGAGGGAAGGAGGGAAGLAGGLAGALGGAGGGAAGGAGGLAGGLGGALGGGGGGGVKTPAGTAETGVAACAGLGASDGLPTTSDSGEVEMTLHQINQDGAGPFTAMVDATSGGTDPAAFQPADVTQNVPGFVAGLSATTTTDFPVKVQMPQGMTCSGTVGEATNVCVVKMQNNTPAGPFGGAAAFTQSPAAKKRAIEYNLRKRRMARAIRSSSV